MRMVMRHMGEHAYADEPTDLFLKNSLALLLLEDVGPVVPLLLEFAMLSRVGNQLPKPHAQSQ